MYALLNLFHDRDYDFPLFAGRALGTLNAVIIHAKNEQILGDKEALGEYMCSSSTISFLESLGSSLDIKRSFHLSPAIELSMSPAVLICLWTKVTIWVRVLDETRSASLSYRLPSRHHPCRPRLPLRCPLCRPSHHYHDLSPKALRFWLTKRNFVVAPGQLISRNSWSNDLNRVDDDALKLV